MSKKGECYDNAVAESFFNTLKTEFISQQTMLQEHKQRVLYLNILKYFTTRLDGIQRLVIVRLVVMKRSFIKIISPNLILSPLGFKLGIGINSKLGLCPKPRKRLLIRKKMGTIRIWCPVKWGNFIVSPYFSLISLYALVLLPPKYYHLTLSKPCLLLLVLAIKTPLGVLILLWLSNILAWYLCMCIFTFLICLLYGILNILLFCHPWPIEKLFCYQICLVLSMSFLTKMEKVLCFYYL